MADGCTEKTTVAQKLLGFLGRTSHRCSAASCSVPGPEQRTNRSLPRVYSATGPPVVKRRWPRWSSHILVLAGGFPPALHSSPPSRVKERTNRSRKIDAVTDRRQDQAARTCRAKRLSTQAA